MFSTRRRRGGAAADLAALFALIAALVTLAVAIVKLLVQGGVAVWRMFGSAEMPKSLQAGSPGLMPVAAVPAMGAPPSSPSPAYSMELAARPAPLETRAVVEHPYREAAPPRSTIFDDPQALESWGHKAFALWASELPMAPSDLTGILARVEPRMRVVGRMRTELDLRRLVWREAPHRGREAASGGPVDAARVDPFGDEAEIRQRSRFISPCSGCGGTGQVLCRACAGTERISCRSCSGEGKVMGYASNGSRRRLNCKPCRGRGTFACEGCRKGKVDCVGCGATGKLERWLEVERERRVVVVTRTGDADLRSLPWESQDVEDADLAKDARIAAVVSRAGALEERDLPPQVPASWREQYWAEMQPRLSPGQRVAAQRFQLLELPAAALTYGFAGAQQVVTFEGMRLAPPRREADQLFHARASRLRGYAVGLGAVPVIALIAYAARGQYFLSGLTFVAVLGLALAAALLFAALGKQTLRRPAKGWALAALAPALGAAVALAEAEPSVGQARAYLRAGLLAKAEAELTALGGDAEVADGWQELYLQRARSRATCQAIVAELARLTQGSPRREQAQALADRAALVASEGALARGDVAAARSELACASEAAREGAEGLGLRVRAELLEAAGCLSARDWACVQRAAERLEALPGPGAAKALELRGELTAKVRAVVDERMTGLARETDVRRRVAAEREAIELWVRYLLAPNATEPAELFALRTALERDEGLLVKLEQREAKLRAAEEAKAAAAERKRAAAEARKQRAAEQAEARKQRAAEQAEANKAARWGNSPLVCNDGTYSPSCTCGRDSYRGCCSHHGGVSGCSAD